MANNNNYCYYFITAVAGIGARALAYRKSVTRRRCPATTVGHTVAVPLMLSASVSAILVAVPVFVCVRSVFLKVKTQIESISRRAVPFVCLFAYNRFLVFRIV